MLIEQLGLEVREQRRRNSRSAARQRRRVLLGALLGVSSLAAGAWELGVDIPQTRQEIIQKTPECHGWNLSYMALQRNADRLWDSQYTIEQLAQFPEIDCFRFAQRTLKSNGLDQSGWKWGLGILASGVGLVTLLFLLLCCYKKEDSGFISLQNLTFGS